MYTKHSKHLTTEGAKKVLATAIDKAKEAGIAITVAITTWADTRSRSSAWMADVSTPHSATKAVCSASTKANRVTRRTAQALDTAHAGLALRPAPERWTAMEGGCPIIVE
jgi:uncharacterized protein GlcG (DUF336 family)